MYNTIAAISRELLTSSKAMLTATVGEDLPVQIILNDSLDIVMCLSPSSWSK